MSNKEVVGNQEQRASKITKITLEKERRFGIYLPDWASVAEAGERFALGDFQEPKLINDKEMAVQLFMAKDHLESGIEKTYPISESHPAGIWEIKLGREKINELLGYKLSITIEGLNSETDEAGTKKRYTEPYLLNIYSDSSEINPEVALAQALDLEQVTLSRAINVEFDSKDDLTRIDLGSIAKGLKRALGDNDDQCLSGEEMAALLLESKGKKCTVGHYDGFALEMRVFGTEKDYRSKVYGDILEHGVISDYHVTPIGLEISIADPSLKSPSYGNAGLIPPNKTEAAHTLAEKIKDTFQSTMR